MRAKRWSGDAGELARLAQSRDDHSTVFRMTVKPASTRVRRLEYREGKGRLRTPPASLSLAPEEDDDAEVGEKIEQLEQGRPRLLDVASLYLADLAVVTEIPGDDVPGDDVAPAVDAGLAEEAPHILGALVVVVGADEAGALRRVGTAAGVLEQQEDARLGSGLSRVEPGHGRRAVGLEPSDEVGQPCNVRRAEELTLAFDLTRVAVRPRRGGRFGGRNARARSPRSSNAFRFRC